jgi:hypothetical protein
MLKIYDEIYLLGNFLDYIIGLCIINQYAIVTNICKTKFN